jgi:hypothetical protein
LEEAGRKKLSTYYFLIIFLIMNKNEPKKPLPVGESFFDSMIETGYYYVDKTLFIKALLDKKAKVTLITRPRRFGKTLNQTMLKCFFEDAAPLEYDKDKRALFNGLKIEAAGEPYLEHQGKYPVIFLSFKDTTFDGFDKSYDGLRYCIAQEFKRHAYVLEKITDDDDKDLFKRLSAKTGAIGEYSRSLRFLCECLERYHGRKVIILIDEYDVPLENSWSRTPRFYDEMVDFVRPLLSSALKDNPHLQFAVITGCLRVSKESIFTGLNNLVMASVLNNAYSAYFGFTQDEVNAMLDYYGLNAKKQIVREWYNGYLFGNTEVYNPWSCLNFVMSWVDNINDIPKPYWVNTSGNDIIRDMLGNMNFKAKAGLETLMAGGTISVKVNENVTYNEIYKNTGNLWNFLFFTGYLKKVGERNEGVHWFLELSIPNMELQYVYETQIQEWFEEHIKERDFHVLFNAVLEGNAETVQKELTTLLSERMSFMDSSESFYHGVMLGVLSRLDGYRLESNTESGDGRCDLALCGIGKSQTAIIFELKTAKEAPDLETECKNALKQIEEKKYAAKWNDNGYKHIIKYGIGFHKKSCKVMKGE